MKLKVKKLDPKAVLPSYAKPGDAGLDLVAVSVKEKDGRLVYGTGLAVEIPEGHVGLIFPRSSICKYDLRLSNAVGVVDSQYRGEIKFIFEKDGMNMRGEVRQEDVQHFWDEDLAKKFVPFPIHRVYKVGDRIGQLIIMPYPEIEVKEVNELSDTERDKGGFGSTGN